APVLTAAGPGDLAAEHAGHGLEAVADAEDREPQVEHGRVEAWGIVGVDARGAPGQNQRDRVLGADLLDGRGVRDALRVDPRLPDASRDELRVLGAEVDDEHVSGCRRLCGDLGVGRCVLGHGDESKPLRPARSPGEPPPAQLTPTIGRRSAPGAASGTTGDAGATGGMRRYDWSCAGRGSASPVLGHSDMARSACAVMLRAGLTPRFAEMAEPSTMCRVG